MPDTIHDRHYYLYIMSSQTRVLYVGVTNTLELRVHQHKAGTGSLFTARYRVKRLVYYEETSDVHAALAREHQIKGWLRARKVALIEADNPEWHDRSDAWTDTNSLSV
jgi:putative endonuclease